MKLFLFLAILVLLSLQRSAAQSCTSYSQCYDIGSYTVQNCVSGKCTCNPGFVGGNTNGTAVSCTCPSGKTQFQDTQLTDGLHLPAGYACLAPGQCLGSGSVGANCAWWQSCQIPQGQIIGSCQ